MPTQLEGKLRPFSLQFDGELEREFLDDYFDRTLKQFRASVFLALFLFSLTGILDAYLFPEIKTKIWTIRYAFVCPCTLALYLVTYLPFIRKYKQLALGFGL